MQRLIGPKVHFWKMMPKLNICEIWYYHVLCSRHAKGRRFLRSCQLYITHVMHVFVPWHMNDVYWSLMYILNLQGVGPSYPGQLPYSAYKNTHICQQQSATNKSPGSVFAVAVQNNWPHWMEFLQYICARYKNTMIDIITDLSCLKPSIFTWNMSVKLKFLICMFCNQTDCPRSGLGLLVRRASLYYI